MSFRQISCQLQDTATGISEWIPTLNSFREGACRNYNKNFFIWIEKHVDFYCRDQIFGDFLTLKFFL